jgi:hypothetical protein
MGQSGNYRSLRHGSRYSRWTTGMSVGGSVGFVGGDLEYH